MVELASSMKPLFEAGVAIHACTAAVASSETKVLPVVTATPVATTFPGEGGEFPLTVSSFHGVPALTASTFIVPAVLM